MALQLWKNLKTPLTPRRVVTALNRQSLRLGHRGLVRSDARRKDGTGDAARKGSTVSRFDGGSSEVHDATNVPRSLQNRMISASAALQSRLACMDRKNGLALDLGLISL
jgi:hypothetical protein